MEDPKMNFNIDAQEFANEKMPTWIPTTAREFSVFISAIDLHRADKPYSKHDVLVKALLFARDQASYYWTEDEFVKLDAVLTKAKLKIAPENRETAEKQAEMLRRHRETVIPARVDLKQKAAKGKRSKSPKKPNL